MNLIARAFCATAAFAAIASAQPIPSYKSQEDYCYHNPDMPTCIKGKPFDIKDLQPLKDPNDPVITGRAVPTAPAPAKPHRRQAAEPQLTPPMTQPLTVPQARRTRGAPADIRLGEIDWRLVHPQSDMLIGLNMAGLAESDLARTLIGQWAGKLGATGAEQQKLIAALSDIPQAVISIRHKEVLAVLTGPVDNFPEQSTVGGLQSMKVSADTVVLGSPSALAWVPHRLKLPLILSASITEARQLARTNHFWVLGKPEAFAAFGQGIGPNTPVTRFKLGVSFQDQFRMDMFLETADPAAAAKILEAAQKGAPRGMKAAIEGNAVHYALVIDRDTALQRFAGFMTDPIGKQFAPLLSAARQMAARQPATPARSAPGKIVIDGLDDGPREIPAIPKR